MNGDKKNLFGIVNILNVRETILSKTFKDTSKVFFANVAATVITFIGSFITLKILPVGEIGKLVAFNNIASIVIGILITGINIAFVRYVSLYIVKDKNIAGTLIRKIIRIEFILGLAALFILLLFAPVIARDIFNKPELTDIIRLAGINILLAIIFTFFKTFFQAKELFSIFAKLTLFQSAFTTSSLSVLAFTDYFTPVSVIWINIVSNALFIFIAYLTYAKHRITVEPRYALPKNIIREIFNYSKWIILMTVASHLLLKTDIFFLTSMVDLGDVAYYSFALTIYSTYLILLTSINTVLLPKISSLQSTDEFIGATKKIFLYSVILALALLPTFFVLKPLIILAFNTKFIPSLPILYVFLAGLIVNIILNPTVNVLLALQQQKILAIVTAVVLVGNVIGHLVFIPLYGLMGAVWVTVGSYFMANAILFIRVLTYLNKKRKYSKV